MWMDVLLFLVALMPLLPWKRSSPEDNRPRLPEMREARPTLVPVELQAAPAVLPRPTMES
jgi:hypothetical protein